MPGVLDAMHMTGGMAVPGRVTVAACGTSGVSPMPETAECHDAEAGGTKQEARDVEVHRRREV